MTPDTDSSKEDQPLLSPPEPQGSRQEGAHRRSINTTETSWLPQTTSDKNNKIRVNVTQILLHWKENTFEYKYCVFLSAVIFFLLLIVEWKLK